CYRSGRVGERQQVAGEQPLGENGGLAVGSGAVLFPPTGTWQLTSRFEKTAAWQSSLVLHLAAQRRAELAATGQCTSYAAPSALWSTSRYSGVQNNFDCYCGNSYGSLGKDLESNCNKPCAGDATKICGGSNRNSVYALTYLASKNTYMMIDQSNQPVKCDLTVHWPVAATRLFVARPKCSTRDDCQAAVFSKRLVNCHLLAFALPANQPDRPDWTLYVRESSTSEFTFQSAEKYSARADCQATVFSKRLLTCHLLAFAYPTRPITLCLCVA
uniref:WSC domain-containing protein n=1 Tax=Macrostomum lignano TaxID=282301 RepID=A0A1I8G6Z3_9PLAT